ncbi:glycosyl transferase family protein [Parasphingorhabdus sp.]|uniref:glycosyl transferase family protein n=1 Tax=Parasphingorhabdus sp. TaxID=2709688 RepID=UPI0030031101
MASYQILPFLDLLQKELLLFASLAFLLGAVDDLLFDGLWMFHGLKRRLFPRSALAPATVENLGATPTECRMAIFVPAWKEAPVIGAMLQRCLGQWTSSGYRIYVGCYPNDPETVAAVAEASIGSGQVRIVMCHRDGPTTKADCLNHLWDALCRDEIEERSNFAAIILHDAEDIVHPDALTLFGHLIGKAALVQLPVIPRRAKGSRWVAGHYGDEFAELHGKQMVLRGALGASLPSAGVGCAFARDGLHKLAAQTQGKPFDANSLTEDYELGLHLIGGTRRGIFARLRDRHGQLVATQEFFPDRLEDAIRQKSRWMVGISLSGWDRLGWHKGWCENWMRLRDRKASFAAIVLAIAYVSIILTGALQLADIMGGYRAQPLSVALRWLLLLNAVFLLWRLSMKCYFVFALYGLREAILSVPRTIVANLINIMAVWRAFGQYIDQLSGSPARWDKTSHFFPAAQDVKQLRPQYTADKGD